MRARGFTLIELMLALAISAVVIAGASTALVSLTSSSLRVRQQSVVDVEAKQLIDWLASRIQEVGGGNVRPHMAVRIEDNCASTTFSAEGVGSVTLPDCDGSDRVTFLSIDASSPQCRVTNMSSGNVDINNGDQCCATGNTDLDDQTVVVVDNQGNWEVRTCTNQVTGSGCHCTVPPGRAAYNVPGSSVDTTAAPYIARGTSVTLYRDPADNVLKMLSDVDGDGEVELRELAPNVADFQATFLWDTDDDGIAEHESVTTPSAGLDSLRMLRLGLIMRADVPSRSTPSHARVLNGPQRSYTEGVLLRSVVVNTGLRNLYVFY